MKISGFTMVRNADKYYFPIQETITSVLPIVDEFIVALGNCDADDKTREKIEAIGSDKIRIIDRVWSEEEFIDGRIFAHETTFALSQCTGDWCFYLQADEVVHEKDHETIVSACNTYLNRDDVDGLLFDYFHFMGDYDHYLPFHNWYRNEIRIVKNNPGVFSYKDAQSFRKGDNEKLNVIRIGANIFHYGWVRPPYLMQSKKKEQDSMHHGREKIREEYESKPPEFDYGPLGKIPVFKGSHPKVMEKLMTEISWRDKLNYTRIPSPDWPGMKHEKFKYRLLTFIENKLMNGRGLFAYSNWNLLRK